MSKLSYEEINNGASIQVFVGDEFAGDLLKLSEPTKPDPEGRLFIGPWAFDGTNGYVPIGWPEIREVANKIEALNTHWNWTLQNASL